LILACPEGKRYPEADDVKPIAPPQPTARWTMCFNTAFPVTKYIRAPSGSACLRAVCLPYLGTLFADKMGTPRRRSPTSSHDGSARIAHYANHYLQAVTFARSFFLWAPRTHRTLRHHLCA